LPLSRQHPARRGRRVLRPAGVQELTPLQALERRPGPTRPRPARLRFHPPHRSPPVADSSGAGSRHVLRCPADPSPYSIRQNPSLGITVLSHFPRTPANSPYSAESEILSAPRAREAVEFQGWRGSDRPRGGSAPGNKGEVPGTLPLQPVNSATSASEGPA